MSITQGQNANASDFINESERNATPANDADRVAKFESDGRIHPFFARIGTKELNAGETITGATTPVPVYQNKTDNELYACDANDNTKYKFIGFVTSNGTDGNAVTFQGAGVVSGFSGLQEGEKYYVQDTAGTIGTSPGTMEILVGVAVSTTTLLIQKAPLRATGTLSLNATGNNVITLGFRPSAVRVTAMYGDTNSFKQSVGGWTVAGGNRSASATCDPTTSPNDFGVATSSSLAIGVIDMDGNNNILTGSVTSITDNGFTINIAAANGSTVALYWEAEGEL